MPEPNGRLGTLRLVDLHTHVLPRIDDGASSDEQALAMLRAAEADGIVTVAATPHLHHAYHWEIAPAVERLNALAGAAGVGVRVVPGCEARITSRLAEQYERGEMPTLNGTTWLLVELYLSDEWPMHLIEGALDRLQAAGLRPVLAHAERYPMVQREPRLVTAFVERGIPVQLNAGSLFGENGVIAQRAAETLIQRRLAHLIASDAHSATWRRPAIRAALLRAAELAGDDYAGWMARVPAAILAGEDVPLPEPAQPE